MLPETWNAKLIGSIKMGFSSSNTSRGNAPSVCAGFLGLASFYCWFLKQLMPKSCLKKKQKGNKPDSNHNTIILRSNLKSFWHQKNCLKLKISSSRVEKKSHFLQDIRSEQIIALWFISAFCLYNRSKYSINWSLRPVYFSHSSNNEINQKW